MTDGPHGVRANHTGPERVQGPATSFPTGVSIASTWDRELVERVGQALGEETRAMGCDVLLGPCVNIVRTPLAGRNFESYSEDPYLAGQIGTAWVKGLQSRGVGASLKHYACNNQEFERGRGDSIVDERTLREIYLAQFETVVKEAQPWTVMCSYNRINGVYASQHDHVLNKILKDEWGFEGAVISDWGANHTITESVAGGLDLEMPGPAKYYGNLLVEAVRNWQIDEGDVDEAARRVLRLIARSGKSDDPAAIPAGSVNTPEHQTLARELAEQSAVLLKNEGKLLPLKGVGSIAVIGPNAMEARIGGGGSSYLEPPYRVSPMAGLQKRLGGSMALPYAKGCDNTSDLPLLAGDLLTTPDGSSAGLLGEYYNGATLGAKPDAVRMDRQLDYWWLPTPEGIEGRAYAARWSGTLTPEESGRHALGLDTTGSARLFIDGKLVLEVTAEPKGDEWSVAHGVAYVELVAGKGAGLVVEYAKPATVDHSLIYLRFGYAPEVDDRIEQAAALPARCDVAVIFAGMPRGFESEGGDRPHMRLPGRQDELISAVAQANPRTVVVLNVGSPVEMPWIDEVPALLLAYYPGQEGGHALARLLAGDVAPSGKLSASYPARYEDNPSSVNYPGGREVRYGEGIFVGYRYYDAKGVAPLFPFGHGLSYTSFAYSDLTAPAAAKIGEPLSVTAKITNTGAVAAKEVVQLYVRDQEASVARPPKELKGFAKVSLAPGESATVRFTLDRRAFAFYDAHAGQWVVEPGAFEILVGSSSRDIRAQQTVTLEA